MTKGLASLVAAAALSMGGGCAYYPLQENPRPAKPLPQEVADYYGYQKGTIEAKIREKDGKQEVSEEHLYTKRGYTFPFTDDTGKTHTVGFDYFLPKRLADTPSPAIVITPYLAGTFPDFIAEIFVNEGWPTLVVHRPGNMFYTRENGEKRYKSPQGLEETLRQGVIGYRKCIDWLCQQPEVDANRIGSVGISMGAIVNVTLSAVDRDADGRPRLKYNAFVMPGEDVAEIIFDSSEGRLQEYAKGLQEQTGQSPDEIKAALDREFRSDPKHLAEYHDPRRILLFLAGCDEVILPKHSWSLRERLGNPETYVAPTGHYTFILTHLPFPWLGSTLKDYFHGKFGTKNPWFVDYDR